MPVLDKKENTAKAKTNWKTELKEWMIALGVSILVALFLTQVIFVNAQIPTESMENTIMIGDRILGFRLSYWFEEPQAGDIVIFKYPDNEKEMYVKRLIGMPGDTVEVKAGIIYINGQERPELNAHIKGQPNGDFGPWQVPKDSYFMMGDNRDASWDSRYWDTPFVKRDALLGKAVVRMFPHPGKLQ